MSHYELELIAATSIAEKAARAERLRKLDSDNRPGVLARVTAYILTRSGQESDEPAIHNTQTIPRTVRQNA